MILFYLFICISVINVIFLGLYLVGANIYDIWQFRIQAKPKKIVRGLRPLVTVLIPAHNEERAIIRCLESVRKNSYRKLEIIVIDDASTDNTKALVREYIAKHPNRNIKLMWRRKNAGKAQALNHALRHGTRGDFIMSLDSDSVLHKDAIKNALRYFDNPKVAGVAANVRVMESPTVLGLLQRFEHMVGYRSKKLHTITNCEFIVGGVASTYRADILRQVKFYDDDTVTEDIGLSLKIVTQGNKLNRIVYGVDVLAMTEGVQTFKALLRQRYRWKMGSMQNLLKYRQLFANTNSIYTRSLTLYRIPMAFIGEFLLLLEPVAIGYLFYLSLQFMNSAMVVGAYMTITGYLLWNIWPDEHMPISKKVKMSFYAPVMYFLFYVMNFVQLVAIFRCFINYKQILLKKSTGSTWVSAQRQGQTQVQFS